MKDFSSIVAFLVGLAMTEMRLFGIHEWVFLEKPTF